MRVWHPIALVAAVVAFGCAAPPASAAEGFDCLPNQIGAERLAQLPRVLREQTYPSWYNNAVAVCRERHVWSDAAVDAATMHLFGTALRSDLVASTPLSPAEVAKLDLAFSSIPDDVHRRWSISGVPDADLVVIETAFTRAGIPDAGSERNRAYGIYIAASGMIRIGFADFAVS